MPVGLVILLDEDQEDEDKTEVRLGYLLAESVWGRGLASELIHGFIEWCRTAGITSIVGGVERDNVPSMRVLKKNGFVRKHGKKDTAEQLYELRLRP
jgi:RimJ/RimL family protein N-acetyltransferase